MTTGEPGGKNEAMHATSPLPSTGEVFLDARGPDRVLRVSWHTEAAVVVLSLWRDASCAGSFRLPIEEVPALVEVLRGGLADSYAQQRGLLDEALDGDLAG
jgi:hypothetical protein